MSTETIFQPGFSDSQDYQADDRSIIVALPAYNEGKAIGRLLRRICRTLSNQALPFRIIVVDDGSQDDTVSVIKSCEESEWIHLIQHEANQGLGGALRSAFSAALAIAGRDDVILTMDADNTHPPELMHRMLQLVDEGNEIVIASRFRPGARVMGLPIARHCMSVGARYVLQLLFPIRGVRDYTCGYRAYRAETLRRAIQEYGSDFVSEAGFACMADVLIKMRRLKPIVREVPLILRYDQKGGISKMNVPRTIKETSLLLIARKIGKRS